LVPKKKVDCILIGLESIWLNETSARSPVSIFLPGDGDGLFGLLRLAMGVDVESYALWTTYLGLYLFYSIYNGSGFLCLKVKLNIFYFSFSIESNLKVTYFYEFFFLGFYLNL